MKENDKMEPVNENAEMPKFTFCEDGDRPTIKKYSTNIKFRPNDRVYVRPPGKTTSEGPYIVSSVDKGQYKLCDANGNLVEGGRLFEEK